MTPETKTQPATEKPKRKPSAATVAKAYMAAIGAQRIDDALTYWDPDGRDNLVGLAELTGHAEIRAYFTDLFKAMPDLKLEILSTSTTGETSAVRWRGTATFDGTGRFQGLAPNGRRIEIEGCDVFIVRDGLIRENNAYINGMDLAQQLGALPPAGSAPEKAMLGAINAATAARKRLAERRGRR